MKTLYTMQEVEDIAESALNALCYEVQEKLGVTEGGLAGLYFSGERHPIQQIIVDYIITEIRFRDAYKKEATE